MNTFVRNTFSGWAILALVCVSNASFAQGESPDEDILFSANVGIFNDYRFRGVSLSDKDIALQGGIDIDIKSGFYVGTWGSSIEQFKGSELELDIYGGYKGERGGLAFDVGALAYTYPGGVATNYWEVYGAIGGVIGTVDLSAGFNYSPRQTNLGNIDNIYIHGEFSTPLGLSGLSLDGHLAYEDGAFGDGKWDWSLGTSFNVKSVTLSLAYVDTNLDAPGMGKNIGGAGVVFGISSVF